MGTRYVFSKQGKNKKYSIFASYGGCGSSFLMKPHPSDFSLQNKQHPLGNIKPEEVYKKKPLERNYRKFNKRAQYQINYKLTLEQNLLRYIKYLENDLHKAAIFSAAYRYHFFSKHSIKNVVFLVRHPIHAYLSYAKPNRHLHVIEAMGGLYSEKSLKWFGGIWRDLVAEYIRLRELNFKPVLIRFEYAIEDSERYGLTSIFKAFKIKKRNYADNKKAEKRMRKIVGRLYDAIYDKWAI
jgi:hypothetical protein